MSVKMEVSTLGKRVIIFDTDAVAVAGNGAERLTGLNFWRPEKNIVITGLRQVPGAVLLNDADWGMRVNRQDTGEFWPAESLDPGNDGGLTDKVQYRIRAGSIIQMLWLGQAAAQANALEVTYVD